MKSALMLGINPNAERQKDDFYATNPRALKLFLENLKDLKLNNKIWECSCGEGHLSKILIEKGFEVKSTDLIERGFGEVQDFLNFQGTFEGDILTNPPFKLAERFVKKAKEILQNGNKLILFLKIQFLESESRFNLFKDFPLKYVYAHSSRQFCCKDGEFLKYNSTTQFYSWFVWEKGFEGETKIRWINPKLNSEVLNSSHSI